MDEEFSVILIFFVIIMIGLLLFCLFTSDGPNYDINRDRKVTIADLAIIEKVVSGTPATPETIGRCDLNRDGLVDNKDIDIFKEFLLEGE